MGDGGGGGLKLVGQYFEILGYVGDAGHMGAQYQARVEPGNFPQRNRTECRRLCIRANEIFYRTIEINVTKSNLLTTIRRIVFLRYN